MLPRAKRIVASTQFGGGFNGGETSFAHLYIRSVMDVCRCLALSGGVLFLDVVTAFATMLRRTIFDVSEGDAKWISSLEKCGFSTSDITAIRDTVAYYVSWDIDSDGNIVADPDLGRSQISINVAKQ